MIGLGIFTAIAICGCIFLMYVLAAFWRELYRLQKPRHAQIVELHTQLSVAAGNGKLLVMDRTDLTRSGKRKTAGRA